jgi:single-stranded-DNA-specific exonuclease
MSKVWKILPQKSDDLLTQLLINRGLVKKAEIDNFFNPKLEDFKKELEIPGTSGAIKRINQAIKGEEQIVVYGDYDVDGVSATAIVYKALASLGAKIIPYIPHREREGYGLSEAGLRAVKELGASLVITVDHGIVALSQAKLGKKLGMDLIITDHHTPKKELPEALAIVHTTKICGAAVAWCLVRKMVDPELAHELLEFVALATICDLMPLIGVNRSLVKDGLKVMNRTKCTGLQALLKESGVSLGSIDAYTLGHVLGPRLNAIGRIEHAIDALRLLCTKDPKKATQLARLMTEANTKRKELTSVAIEEAKLLVDVTNNVHVVHSKTWIPGIIGLIAGRVADEYSAPAIAISVGEVHSKGSARSVDGINIVEVMRQCGDILIDVGGHKGAAGFTIETTKIEIFQKRMITIFKDLKVGEARLEIEAEVPSKKLTKSLAGEIARFDPFGQANPQPILASRGVIVSDIRTVGIGHLKFKADGIDAIAFGMGEWKDILRAGQLVDLAYYLEINRYNGNETLQLKVKDIRTL